MWRVKKFFLGRECIGEKRIVTRYAWRKSRYVINIRNRLTRLSYYSVERSKIRWFDNLKFRNSDVNYHCTRRATFPRYCTREYVQMIYMVAKLVYATIYQPIRNSINFTRFITLVHAARKLRIQLTQRSWTCTRVGDKSEVQLSNGLKRLTIFSRVPSGEILILTRSYSKNEICLYRYTYKVHNRTL